jgi:hypothetical protein
MISAVSEVSTEDLMVPEISADDANSRDRTRRLRCAADPATPVPMLLELAMEFPEVVAANPSIRVGLAADPRPFASAGAVAIACLLTSPAIERGFADALEAVVMREGLHESVDHLRAYLSEWRRRGARRLAVDHSKVRPATDGLDPSIERTTRGQALLAQRLGWSGVTGWKDNWEGSESRVTCTPAGQERRDSALHIFLPNWLERGATGLWELERELPSEAKVLVEVAPGTAVGQFTISRDGDFDGEISYMSSPASDSIDARPSQEAVHAARRVLAPLCESARHVEAGQCVLVADVGDVHTLILGVDAAYEALAEVSEPLALAIEEMEDDAPDPPSTVAAFLNDSVSPSDWDGLPAEDLVRSLRERGASELKFGSPDEIRDMFSRVANGLLPQAGKGQAGACDDAGFEFQIAIADPSGTVGIVFGTFMWVDERWRRVISLDPTV